MLTVSLEEVGGGFEVMVLFGDALEEEVGGSGVELFGEVGGVGWS
jgi:hypothetical protein